MAFPTAYSKPTGFIVDVGFIVVGDNLEAIGATVGGIKWDPKKTVREVEFDGKSGPIAGMQRTIKYEPTLSGKIKRGGGDFISILEPGSESDGSSGSDGNVITLLDARTPWTVDMMLENVYYVGRQEDGDTFYVHFPFAYVSKYSLQTKDNDEGEWDVEIIPCLSDTETNINKVPFNYGVISGA